MIQTAGVLRITSYPKDVPTVDPFDSKRWQADHRNAVKWLKQPNLKAEVKRALTRPKGLLSGCKPGVPLGLNWVKAPLVVKFMTHKQLKSELGKQLKRLS